MEGMRDLSLEDQLKILGKGLLKRRIVKISYRRRAFGEGLQILLCSGSYALYRMSTYYILPLTSLQKILIYKISGIYQIFQQPLLVRNLTIRQ
jgi:hypothetical protein